MLKVKKKTTGVYIFLFKIFFPNKKQNRANLLPFFYFFFTSVVFFGVEGRLNPGCTASQLSFSGLEKSQKCENIYIYIFES